MKFEFAALMRGAVVGVLGVAAGGFAGAVPVQAVPAASCGNGAQCEAPTVPAGGTQAGQSTQAYAGLRWNFGDQKPAIVTGLRFTNTDPSGLVLGAKLDAAFTLGGDSFAPTVRLLGVAGNRLVQGEFGFGVDTATMSALLAAGVQLPYAAAGANFSLDGYIAPYVEVNGLSQPAKPLVVDGAMTCPDHFSLLEVDSDNLVWVGQWPISISSTYIRDGSTCVLPQLG
jgi:hypothetical protein